MSTGGRRRRWSIAPALTAVLLLAADRGLADQRGSFGSRLGQATGRRGYWSPGRGMGNYLGGSIHYSGLVYPQPPPSVRTRSRAAITRAEQLRTASVRPAHYGSIRHGRYGTDIVYTPPQPAGLVEPAPEPAHVLETPLGSIPIVPMPWGSPTTTGRRFWGGVVTELPEDCVQVDIDPGRYYFFENGYYYRRCFYTGDVCYVGVRPVIGVWVPNLPAERQRIRIADKTYYRYNDVFYARQERKGMEGFVVVEAPPKTKTGAMPHREATEEAPPDPYDILQRMSDFLASAEKFSFEAVDMTEAQIDKGQMVDVSSRCTALVSRPDGFRIEIKGDGIDKRFYYNGRTLKGYDRWRNTWSMTHVPGTIDAALDYIADRFGIAIPTSDVLYANAYNALVPTTDAAAYLGINGTGGYRGHHLVFIGPMLDWQLWVQPGDQPVPLKLVIDYKLASGTPQYTAVFRNWNFAPNVTVDTFAFRTPATARRVGIVPARRSKDETIARLDQTTEE